MPVRPAPACLVLGVVMFFEVIVAHSSKSRILTLTPSTRCEPCARSLSLSLLSHGAIVQTPQCPHTEAADTEAAGARRRQKTTCVIAHCGRAPLLLLTCAACSLARSQVGLRPAAAFVTGALGRFARVSHPALRRYARDVCCGTAQSLWPCPSRCRGSLAPCMHPRWARQLCPPMHSSPVRVHTQARSGSRSLPPYVCTLPCYK